MSLEDMHPEDYGLTPESVVKSARDAVQTLFGGPPLWENMNSAMIRPESVPNFLLISMIRPKALDMTYLDTLRDGVHIMVEQYYEQMVAWAKETGRADLLMTVSERLEAVARDDADL